MRTQASRRILAACCLLVLGAVSARADEPPRWHPWRLREWPGRLYYGRGGGEHTFERAGYPNQVSRIARPSNTDRYYGYYVVGGSVRSGSGLGPTQGTYGWDYGGFFHNFKRIELLWNPERVQSGYGRYKIDGPPVKDVGPYVEKLKVGPAVVHEIRRSRSGEGGHE